MFNFLENINNYFSVPKYYYGWKNNDFYLDILSIIIIIIILKILIYVTNVRIFIIKDH
jgi:hypothetical protein